MTVIGNTQGSSDILLDKKYGHLLIGIDFLDNLIYFLHQQWGKAVTEQKIFHIQDEQRAVDYAMGLIARAWGHFGDFQDNMRARQNEDTVQAVSTPIEMKCPVCGAPVPVDAAGMFKCKYCDATLKL